MLRKSDTLSPGTRFCRWTVIREVEPVKQNRRFLCRCDCGTEKLVWYASLATGDSRSCGCLKRALAREQGRAMLTKHGEYGTPEWIAWRNMLARCYNSNGSDFSRYGGRGIVVCERWRDSVMNFIADMGRKPSRSHQLERIDNDGPYEPGNCRWATAGEQARNRHTNQKIAYGGETLTIQEWARRTGIGAPALYWRLHAGWKPERILGKTVARTLTLNGETKTVRQWSETTGIKVATINDRLRRHCNIEDALRS